MKRIGFFLSLCLLLMCSLPAWCIVDLGWHGIYKDYGIFYGSVPDVAVSLTITAEGANNYKANYRLRTMTVAGEKSSNNKATDYCDKEHYLPGIGHGFRSEKYWFLIEYSGRIVYWEQADSDDGAWNFGSSTLIDSRAGTVTVYYAPLSITLESAAASCCSITQNSKVSDTMVSRTVNVYVNGSKVGSQSGTHKFPVRGDIKSSDLIVSPKSGWVLDTSKGSGTGVTASGTTYNVYLLQQYKVEGSIDHGTKTNSPQTVNYGSSNSAMVFTPATNYAITGVTVNGVAVSGWTASSYTYPAQTITENKSVVVSTANKYTVSYNGNSSTSGSTGDQSFVYGTAQNLRVNGFTRTLTVSFDGQGGTPASSSLSSASTFNGWEDRGRIIYGGTTYAYTQFDAPYYSNVYSDLYAAFGYNKYSLISHYINNGIGEGRTAKGSTPGLYPPAALVNNLSTEAGYTVPLYANWTDNAVTLPAAAKEHYKLDGWYTSASGGTRVGGAGDSYVPTSTSVTLYARWSIADADVVITRSGLSEGESAVYTVVGGGRTYTVILTGPDASATLSALPIDTYTVTENGWSWNSQIPAPQGADITGGHTFSFTASKKTGQPLNAESSRKNW